jgi:hypothetical protein
MNRKPRHKGQQAKTDIGGNVGRYITTLSLNDRESGEGASAEFVAHLGSTLE